MAPHHETILQGEVKRDLWGLALTYTTVKQPMRQALSLQTLHANGLRAKLAIEYAMDQPSLDWLDYLLESYPDHVVEFSSFRRPWGTVPGYNTVFWEVRRY